MEDPEKNDTYKQVYNYYTSKKDDKATSSGKTYIINKDILKDFMKHINYDDLVKYLETNKGEIKPEDIGKYYIEKKN